MGFSYDYQGSSTFLTYTVEQNDVIDSMTLGMLTNNRISGLVPTLFTQMDDERYIKYLSLQMCIRDRSNTMLPEGLLQKTAFPVWSISVGCWACSEAWLMPCVQPKTICLTVKAFCWICNTFLWILLHAMLFSYAYRLKAQMRQEEQQESLLRTFFSNRGTIKAKTATI